MDKVFGFYFEIDKCYDEIYSKHFKKLYNGKPTRRYLKLVEKIKIKDGCSDNKMKNLFL